MSLDRATAEQRYASAEAADVSAKDAVRRAEEQLEHAEAKYDEARSATAMKAIDFARADLGSAQREAKRAAARLIEAHTALASVRRSEAVAKYERLKEQIASFYVRVREQYSAELTAHDRAIDETVLPIARDFAEMHERYVEAEALAEQLRMSTDLDRAVPRPRFAEVRLEIARAVTTARVADGRDPVALAFLAHIDMSWRMRGMSAADLAVSEAYAEKIRREDEQLVPVAAMLLQQVARGQPLERVQPPAAVAAPAPRGAPPASPGETVLHDEAATEGQGE